MGLSIWQLLIVLLIVLLLFGTKRLKSIGGDLGAAIKGFRESLGGDKDETQAEPKKLAQSEAHPSADTHTQVKRESEKTSSN